MEQKLILKRKTSKSNKTYFHVLEKNGDTVRPLYNMVAFLSKSNPDNIVVYDKTA